MRVFRFTCTTLLPLGGLLLVLGILASCGQESEPAQAVDANGQLIHPDDSVTLTADHYACQSAAVLVDAIDAFKREEYAQWAKIIDDYPECITAKDFPRQRWTAMSVRGAVVQIGAVAPADFEAFRKIDAVKSAFGAYSDNSESEWWVPAAWLQKIKSTETAHATSQ